MRSELIVSVSPKALIADDYLQEALKTHPTAVGYAVAKDDLVIKDAFTFDDNDLLDAVLKTQEQYKDHQRFFHFYNLSEKEMEGCSEDSEQPFTILTKKNKKGEPECIMAAMLDGDFGHYYKEEGETPAAHMVKDYLREKVEACYRRNGQDMTKTCEEMKGGGFRKDIRQYLLPRGVITIIPAGSPAFNYSENKELAGEYPWGDVSKKLGIEPAAVTDASSAETTPISGTSRPLTFAQRKAAAKATSTPKPIEEKEKPKTTGASKGHPALIMKKVDSKDVVWVRPDPQDKLGVNAAKHWWDRHATLAKPPHDKPQLLFEGFPAYKLRSDSPLVAFAKAAGATIEAEIEQTAFRAKMEQAKENKTKEAAAKLELDMSGLLNAEDKKEIVAMVKDIGGGWFKTPAEQAVELSSTPAYSTQVQVPLDKLLTASRKFWMRQEKRALANFIAELCVYIQAHSLAKPTEEKAEPVVTTGEKKKGFGKKKAA